MPVGDLIFVCRYQLTDPYGVTYPHRYCKRVSSGREGIALRDSIVNNGGSHERVWVDSCSFYPVEGTAQAA